MAANYSNSNLGVAMKVFYKMQSVGTSGKW